MITGIILGLALSGILPIYLGMEAVRKRITLEPPGWSLIILGIVEELIVLGVILGSLAN